MLNILLVFTLWLFLVFGNDYLHDFKHKYHVNHHEHMNHTWESLAEVNGLKNQDVVFVLTSTAKSNAGFLRERIMPSSRTWMRLIANAYVIIEDTIDVRFLMRNCQMTDYPSFTSFNCHHHEPQYILSRNCTDAYYAAVGICCKVDEAIHFVAEAAELFSHLKYLILADDDTYFRVDEIFRWLSYIDKSNIDHLPIIGGVDTGLNPDDNNDVPHGIWHVENCTEVHIHGSYQPVLFNKKAIERISVGVKSHAITDTCKAFDLAQDVALGIFGWLYQLYHIRIPGIAHKEMLSELKPDDIMVHHIRPNFKIDDCHGASWSDELKHNQDVVVGCGTLKISNPKHDKTLALDMYDVWQYFRENGTQIELIDDTDLKHIQNGYFKRIDNDTIEPAVMLLGGYKSTKHSINNDIVTKWVPFTLLDCNDRGKIKGLPDNLQPFNQP